ncbi:MAG: M48 family metalloprotease [Pontibacterium sp.]
MRFFKLPLLTLCLSLSPLASNALDGTQLPRINDGAYSITPEEEFRLGHAWVRSLRGTSRLSEDPIIKTYMEDLVWSMTSHSQLADKRLTVLVIDKAVPNAFAAPGGILGFHTGIITVAQSEAELASVVAHELAHLSQRHYAARVDAQRQNTPLMVAGILGSILVASADGEAGSAALLSTLAGQQQLLLSYSRQNEREADYIGMQTLAAAGYSPSAMPKMFMRLQAYNRFSQSRLEFLQTHPISESRIADSQNRARVLTNTQIKRFTTTEDFPLIKARLNALHADSPKELMAQYASKKEKSDDPLYTYGELVSALHAGEFEHAEKLSEQLPQAFKDKMLVSLTLAEVALKRDKPSDAIALTQNVTDFIPDHYAANMILAHAHIQAGEADKASHILSTLASQRPEDEQVWYWLSEAEGLANHEIATHLARTEYFLLTGRIDSARKQIKYAKRSPNISKNDAARVASLEKKVMAVSLEMKSL